MDQTPNHSDSAAERLLFRRLADGTLSAAEFQELEQRLLEDPALRQRYVLAMGMESALHQVYGDSVAAHPAARERKESVRLGRIGLRMLVSACAAVLLIAGGFWMQSRHPQGGEPDRQAGPDVNPAAGHFLDEVVFAPAKSSSVDDVAMVTHFQARKPGSELMMPRRLPPGVLTLREGTLWLEFLHGARVILEGPVELELLSPDSARLLSGAAAAHIPERARGFVLLAPDTAVVDLGTEFAVSVNERGQSEIHVVQGEVEVSMTGEDGSTLSSERLKQAGTLRVSLDRSRLEPLERPSLRMPSVQIPSLRPLAVPESYAQEVIRANPLIYWRFESLSDRNEVRNEVGEQWPGRLVDECPSPTVRVDNGFARFVSGNLPRYFDVGPDQPLPGLNSGSHSFELWFNPDYLHWATLLNTSPVGENWSVASLSHIELACRTWFVHPSGAVRFMYRSPPEDERRKGINLFTPEGCIPGQWHHVVTVRTPDELRLYLNGKLVRKLKDDSIVDDAAYRLILGQHKWNMIERQFVGGIDEFALYPRELTDAEVERHYELMMAAER